MEQYSNLNVHGKITQKAAQGTGTDDVVKYPTLTDRVPNALPPATSANAGKAVVVNSAGNGLEFGEAGKVDDIKLNTTSVVSNKVATISTGTGLTSSNGTINHSNSVTAQTSGIGSATAVPVIKYDAQGHITSVTTATIYPPTTAGTNGQLWKSDGSGAGVWVNQSTIAAGSATNDADGNAIKTTYAKLNSPALTGTPTAPTATAGTNTDQIATTKFVKTAIDNLPEPMIFRGTVGTNGTITTLPTAAADNEGYTYKVITAGTYANQAAKVGDTFISAKTGDTTYAWTLIPSGDEPSGTVTNVATGVGLTGGPITSTGTIKAKLKSETNATYDSNNVSNTSGRQYAVVPDKTNGYLSVNVPWTDQSVTSTANHYTPATVSGNDKSASASGATAAWSIDVVTGVTLNTDGKGHVTGLSVASGKIPSNPNTDTKVRQTTLNGSDNVNRAMILAYNVNTTTGNTDNIVYRSTKIYANDSTGTITATTFNGNATTATNATNWTSNPFAASDVTLADM